MIKDKNGIEIKIGDRVHYKRPETNYEIQIAKGGVTKTMTRPAKDEVFTVTEFVNSPFVKYGHPWSEDKIWVTGPELDSTRLGTKNAVSPLAVVKVDTFVKKAMPTFNLV